MNFAGIELDNKWELVIKIIGLICLFVAAVVYGEYKHTQGRTDQCLIQNTFLLDDGICHDAQYFKEKGFRIDKDCKCLVPEAFVNTTRELIWNLENGS